LGNVTNQSNTSNDAQHSVAFTVTAPPPSHLAANDFNGDAVSDLLWRHGSNGLFTTWNNTGNGFAANAFVGGVNNALTLAGTMDFNGDRMTDLVWNNGGIFTIWDAASSGNSTADSFSANVYVSGVAPGWGLGTGDFNGDGKGDLIWQNGNTFTEWQSTG